MPHRPRHVLIALLFTCLAGSFVGAEDTPKVEMGAKADAPLHFLKPTSVDFVKLLPPPPGPQTDEAREDLETVVRVTNRRTDAEVTRAKSEQKLTMAAFASVIGDWFTAENLPVTAKLIKHAESDSKFFSGAAKAHFGRVRPPEHLRVKDKAEADDEPSYPSGHSTRGVLFASILIELDPAQKDALMVRAREIGWDRVILGVHYPSDIVAGRVLGQALAQAMSTNPKFREELAAAREEFIEAQKQHAAED